MLLPYFAGSADNGYRIGVLPVWFFNASGLLHALLFYGNAYVISPALLNRRSWWLFMAVTGFLVAGVIQLKLQLLNVLLPETLAYDSTLRFVIAPTVGIVMVSLVYRTVLERSQVEKEQIRRREEHLRMQLQVLRSQANPHFLFNAFTNLVSLARRKSDALEHAIIRLADITRYMHFNTGENAVVEKEIECLDNYIELQKLRFGDHLDIAYEQEVQHSHLPLPMEPMILLPFVENAFKHGSAQVGKPWIRVVLAVKDGVLTFTVDNSFDGCKLQCDDSVAVGLQNVKARLHLLYGDSHTLVAGETGNVFHIHLTVRLNDSSNSYRR